MTDFLQRATEMEQALLAVDRLGAEEIIHRLAASPAIEVVERVVVPAMERIGNGWEAGSVALSQVYMSARICEELVTLLEPGPEGFRNPQPRMAITVLDDYHMLGKRIIHSVLRAAGYEVADYGRTVIADLVGRVAEDGIEVLLISTLMLRSALEIMDLRRQLQERGLTVVIVVGGAPFRFDDDLWKEVGADATAAGAKDLLPLMKRITEERR